MYENSAFQQASCAGGNKPGYAMDIWPWPFYQGLGFGSSPSTDIVVTLRNIRHQREFNAVFAFIDNVE